MPIDTRDWNGEEHTPNCTCRRCTEEHLKKKPQQNHDQYQADNDEHLKVDNSTLLEEDTEPSTRKLYKEIFNKVLNTLRTQSKLTSSDFDSRLGDFLNLDYKRMTDSDIYWKLVCVMFYSGMRACTVTQKLPAIKNHLYDFRKVKYYSVQDLDRFLSDPQTIHYPQKFAACVANAKEFDNLLKKYSSFSKYLESFGDLQNQVSIDNLRLDLRKKFKYLGERTVNHFLMDLGVGVLKPDRVVCRIFKRLKFIDNEDEIDRAIRVGRDTAEATGFPIRYIDIVFVKYGQQGKDDSFGLNDGICLEKRPKCRVCGVTKYCHWYARNQSSQPSP